MFSRTILRFCLGRQISVHIPETALCSRSKIFNVAVSIIQPLVINIIIVREIYTKPQNTINTWPKFTQKQFEN